MKLSIKDVLLTSRPFWWITTSAPFVAGYLSGHQSFSWVLVGGALYFVFPYNLMMYGVNDIFDYESDILNPRKAGIEGAVLAKSKHLPLALVIALINIPLLAWLFMAGDQLAQGWLLLIVVMALAYSVKHIRLKEVPVLDSMTSAFHYTSPFLMGVFLAGGANYYLPVFLAFYVWAMSNHAFGAIQDIKPDREAGIDSIATRLGSERVVYFCLGLYSIAALLPVLLFGWSGFVPSLLLTPYIWLVAKTWPHRREPSNPIFHRHWQVFTYLNYVVGGMMTIYLIAFAIY